MQRTTLRTITKRPNNEQALELPEGIFRVIVKPLSQFASLVCSFQAGEVEQGLGNQATFQNPYDSGDIRLDHGPVYFVTDTRGTLVEVTVLHANPNDYATGEGGGSEPPYELIYKSFIPSARRSAKVDSSVGDTSWVNLSAWSSDDSEVTSLLDTELLDQTYYLVGLSWSPRNSPIPAGATIREIILHLDCESLPEGQSDIDIDIAALKIVRNGQIQSFDYVTNNGNGPLWNRNGVRRITFQPSDNPLWGQSWTADDFNSSNPANPNVVIQTAQPGSPPTNETQSVSMSSDVTGGTFTLSFQGVTTGPLAWNISAAALQTALEALSNIAPGDVACTGGPLPGTIINIEFTGAFANQDVPLLVSDGTNLTMASGGTIVVTTTQNGGPRNFIIRLLATSLAEEAPSYLGVFRSQTEFAVVDYTATAFLTLTSTAAEIRQQIGSIVLSGWSGQTIGVSNVLVRVGENAQGVRYIEIESVGMWSGVLPNYHDPDVLVYSKPPFLFRGWQGVDFTIAGQQTWIPDPAYQLPPPPGSIYPVHGIKQEPGSAVDEIQVVTILGNPTAGTFTLTFRGTETTAPIAYNANAAAVKAALEALASIDLVTVTQAGSVYTITFQGSLAGLDQPQLTATPSFSGAGVTVTTIQEGTTGQNEVQRVTLIGGEAGGLWGLVLNSGAGDETTANIAYNASAATVQAALEALATPVPGDILVTGNAGGPYLVEFQGNLELEDIPLMKAKPGLSNTFGFAISAKIADTDEEGSIKAAIRYAEVEVGYER